MTQQLIDFDQPAQLARVSTRIAPAVIAFVKSRAGQRFTADELRAYVSEVTGTLAPASADRVLRDCRQRGLVSYKVIDRAASVYEAQP